MKVNANVVGMEKVKNLIELLSEYEDQLPTELKSRLLDVADCDVFEYDYDYFVECGIPCVEVHADGYLVEKVISINPILKRLKVAGKGHVYFNYCNVIRIGGGQVMSVGGEQ